MGRSVMLSNGEMLVGLDEHGLVHDFYYPYVGLENLTTSRSAHHKIGIWVNGQFSWVDDGSWNIAVDFESDALISNITMEKPDWQIKLKFLDFVDYQYSAFCRRVEIINNANNAQEVRLFFHQVFQISRAGRGDTALYVPSGNYILNYKGKFALLVYAQNNNKESFDQFSVGNYGIEGKDGTFRDAEDGELSGNLVEHGGVDSVIRCSSHVEPGESVFVDYWLVANSSQFESEGIHDVLLKQGLSSRLEQTREYWSQWMKTAEPKLQNVDTKYLELAKKSLLVIKAHVDRQGGIIASGDSSIYNYARDYYSYVWPRDGVFSILPLISLGYQQEAKNFFEFCADTMHPAGYMRHKYQPDRSLGSSWHPQMQNGTEELPIQEDETAIVIYALNEYLKKSEDSEFVKGLYGGLLRPGANFMTNFIDQSTNLPHASYDLWEQKFATHTYTVTAVIAALKAAAEIAEKVGEQTDALAWNNAAGRMNISLRLLYSEDLGHYRKSLLATDGDIKYDDPLCTSSFYGLSKFDVHHDSQGLENTVKAVEGRLLDSCPIGGVPRYENDKYFLHDTRYTGNPWIISTLWLAQYYINHGRASEASSLIDWVQERASNSGMLAEQVDPSTGYSVSVSPLVWSHAAFLETVLLLSEHATI